MFKFARSRCGRCAVACASLVAVATSRAADRCDLDTALVEIGLALSEVHIPRVDLDRVTNRTQPGSVQAYLFAEPFRCKAFMEHVRASLLEELTEEVEVRLASAFWQGLEGVAESQTWAGGAAGLANASGRLSRWGDRVVYRTLLGNPVEKELIEAAEADALVRAIAAIHTRAGEPLTEARRVELETAVRAVPVLPSRAAALVLQVIDRAIQARDRAIRHLDRDELQDADRLEELLTFNDLATTAAVRDRLAALEVGHLYAAAQDLSIAVHLAARLVNMTPLVEVSFEWDTPFGRVSIDGNGATTYSADVSHLLILDLGGDDTYHAGGGAVGLDSPVSVLIDVRGRDQYTAATAQKETATPAPPATQPAPTPAEPEQAVACAFGAGILGIGILVDLEGDDSYEIGHFGLGSGLFGVGILDDWAGDDSYHSVTNSQASAMGGLGLLIDRSGTDTYHAYSASQAFADVQGVAALVDLAGNDSYTAEDTDIRFPAAQSAEHNNSMCQGAAVGHRADYSDGYAVPGGFAVLFDGGGNDAYSCGVFGQGTGYWMGVGLLIDAAGDDSYLGQWYVQGASAHFALGALLDEGGNDTYDARLATSQGTGHDLSVGFLADLGGDDTYKSAGLTMGSGNAAGIGIVVDAAGDDDYTVRPDVTLGYADVTSGVRSTMINFGLFLDAGGTDTYSQPYAGDNKCWGIGPERALQGMSARRYAAGVDTQMTPEQLESLWLRR